MHSPVSLLIVFLGVLLIMAPIDGKLILLPHYLLALVITIVNEILIKKRLLINHKNHYIVNLSILKKIYLIIFILIITNAAISYYTGLTILSAVENILSGKVNYEIYQLFFKKESRADFELVKLIHITSIAFIKIVAFYCIYSIVFCLQKKLWGIIFMAPMLIFSVSRGTSIEFFEIFLFLTVVMYIKSQYQINKHSHRIYGLLLIIFILASNIFMGNVSLRLGESSLENLCFGPFCYKEGLGTFMDPVFYFLSGYFLGGFYNSNVFFSGNDLVTLMLPGNIYFSHDLASLCAMGFQCAAWEPLLPKLFTIMGIFTFFILILLHKVVNVALSNSMNVFITCLILYNYTYLIFSLFVGEGIFSSSSNSLIFYSLSLALIIRSLRSIGNGVFLDR
jgi:hypothetical protein